MYSVLAAYSVINQQQSTNKINNQHGVILWWINGLYSDTI